MNASQKIIINGIKYNSDGVFGGFSLSGLNNVIITDLSQDSIERKE